MLAFVDESGDTGSKILNRSSRYFVVAVVMFRRNDDAERCDDAIGRLRRDLHLPFSYEFHYTENLRKVRRAFLERVFRYSFTYHLFAIDKTAEDTSELRIPSGEGIYQFAIRRAFENAKPWLDAEGTRGTSVIIDRGGDKKFRNEMAAHLRRHITDDDGNSLIGKVKTQRSSGNNLLQLADYIASMANRSLRGRDSEVALIRHYLTPHEGSRELWPNEQIDD